MKQKKLNILITDVPEDKKIEEKIFGKNYNVHLTNFDRYKSLSKKFKSTIDAIITGHYIAFDKKEIKQFPNCKSITRYGIGYNNIDIQESKKNRVKVFVVPDYGVDEVSDHALGLILSLNRSLLSYDNFMREGSSSKKILWDFTLNLNQSRLKNMKLGIVGLGRIGSSLARKAVALNMNVVFYDPYINDGYDKVLNIQRAENLDELTYDCDIISLHLPYSKKNHNIINESFLKKLKKKIIFINVSRGGLVSSKSLAKFYGKKISKIGLDVFESEPPTISNEIIKLWKKKENVGKIIISPHCAFYSLESLKELRFKAATTTKKFLEKNITTNCVN